MPEFFSSDGSLPLQFAVIFAVLVVLLLTAYLVVRRATRRGVSMPARGGARSGQLRLGIVDIYELDRQRQLILLRRDDVEHLLLVGGPNDVVVERDVQRSGSGRASAERMMRPEPAPDMPVEPRPADAPSFEMPLSVPPPPSGPASQSMPAETVEPAEQAGARAQANRFLRRTPPPLVNPRSDASRERARPADTTPDPTGIPPMMAASEPRAVDPAVLSDMARQLEVALRRPSSAVTPPPSQKRPAAPLGPPAAPDPIAAAMAASQAPRAEPSEAASPTSGPAAPPRPRPAPASDPAAGQTVTRPVPAPRLGPDRTPEPAEAGKDNNSFSVEQIEAEFARLLGRPLDKKE